LRKVLSEVAHYGKIEWNIKTWYLVYKLKHDNNEIGIVQNVKFIKKYEKYN
jgi:hypothetical protein